MFVRTHMKLHPVTVMVEESIASAREILASHHFRHLPIVDKNGRLLGMVTDRDIRSATPSTVMNGEQAEELSRVEIMPVAQIMSREVASLTLHSTLDDALIILDREKVGALPVLDVEEKLVGIFSIRDLILAYKELFGLGEQGSALVAVRDDGKPRPLTRLVQTLEEHNIHFSRVVRMKPSDAEDEGQIIYIRVNTFNLHAVHAALDRAGFVIFGNESIHA